MYFNSKIADIIIGVNYKYAYTKKVFENYLVEDNLTPSFIVTVTDDMIEFERKYNSEFPPAYVENIAVFRYIANEVMLNYNCILFHSSAIEYKGNAFMFTAKSGTGKSTHTRLLRDYNSNISYINDDKPFIRYFENEKTFYVYGTPWKGKHNLGENVKIPLKAICFLNRGENNSITKINPLNSLNEIMMQTVKPTTEEAVTPFMNTISALTENVDFYKLYCNLSSDAPKTSFSEMIEKY